MFIFYVNVSSKLFKNIIEKQQIIVLQNISFLKT